MTTIVTRAGKGLPLTNVEVDANFTNLNTEKLEKASNLSDLANTATARSNLGLGNVNNTSDANKPISTATQTALNLKLNTSGGTITANSSSAALTITQTGTGNAFVVEDAASDTTPFVIDNGGRVGIGTPPLYAVDGLSIASAASFSPQVFVRNSANDGAGSYLNFEKVRSSAIVQNGDDLGTLAFRGFDGTQQINAAFIYSEVDGTPGTNDMPGRLVFSTTADGASTPTERMRIDSSGRVSVGGSAIDGPLHLIDTGAGRDLGGELNSNNAFGFRHEFYKSRGTNSAKTVVAQNDELGVLDFLGHDGSAYQIGAAIRAYSDGAPGAGAMPGRIVFFTTPLGSASIIERLRIDSTGNVLVNSPAGLGYGTGAGGTVTQATSKSTAVTLNKPTGQITMHNAALAAGTQVNFTLTNSLITVNDLILVNVRTPTAASYSVRAGDIASGSCLISLTNVSGGPLSDAVVISFAIIKGAVA